MKGSTGKTNRSPAHPAPGGASRRRGSHRGIELAAAVVIVGALVAAAHWPVLGAQALSLDDRSIVTNNPLIEHPGLASVERIFRDIMPSKYTGYYIPLSMVSLMLDDAMGGRPDDLRAFHRTSLTLHVLNTMLIVLLLYGLFGATIPAALAGLMFGLHPLTVEPTAWVTERKTLLSTFFALACILSYVLHCRRRERAWLAASVAFYAMALLGKPTVVMLPLLLLLLDYWPLKRFDRGAVLEKWLFFLLFIGSAIITVISQERTRGIMHYDYLQWPLRACYVLAFYGAKMIRPVNLSSVYEPPVPLALSNPAVLPGIVAVCALTALVVVLWRRTRAPLIGWIFFVLALAPTLGLVKYSWLIASDKYVYFPAVGILIVIGFGLTAAWRGRARRGVTLKAVLCFAVVSILAFEARGVRATLGNWTDSITLYRHMAAVAPNSAVIQTDLGVLLYETSSREEAMGHLRRAVELDSTLAVAHFNLGNALGAEGRLAESIAQFRTADELWPGDVATICNLGTALALAGRLDEAAVQFTRALRLEPGTVVALDQLGSVLMLQGRTEEAVGRFREALAAEPGSPDINFRLATALQKLGRSDSEAAACLRQSVRARPDWPEPIEALARLLATSTAPTVRDPQEAVRLAERAVDLTGGKDPKALDALKAARAAAGR